MFDGIWNVYTSSGEYLGSFETCIGNEVLILDAETAAIVHEGTVLHMDEVFTQKAWIVVVGDNYKGDPVKYCIKKVADREKRYPEKPIKIRIVSHKKGFDLWDVLRSLGFKFKPK